MLPKFVQARGRICKYSSFSYLNIWFFDKSSGETKVCFGSEE